MTWHPIQLDDLGAMISRELAECSEEQRAFFERVAVAPKKWQSPYGDDGGGFWVVAIHRDRVLWYNDIEDGFNVSTFEVQGEIPEHEDWCNDDPLKSALPQLQI
jgi:hypothetical protein